MNYKMLYRVASYIRAHPQIFTPFIIKNIHRVAVLSSAILALLILVASFVIEPTGTLIGLVFGLIIGFVGGTCY